MNTPTPERQLEARLRRFRPVEPPPGLRARVVATASVRPVWPWMAAGVAALLLAGTLHVLSARTLEAARMPSSPESVVPVAKALADHVGEPAAAESLRVALVASARKHTTALSEALTQEGMTHGPE